MIAAFFIGGCVSLPEGPNVTALPGSGKSFDYFIEDDAVCRGYAHTQIGGKTPEQVSTESAQQSAVLGTVLGAAAGAVIDGEHGAGVGAATGLLFGALTGLDSGRYNASRQQQRYDGAYVQCMYAKGHRVPVSAQFIDSHAPNRRAPPRKGTSSQVPPDYYPYPPPDYPPPAGY